MSRLRNRLLFKTVSSLVLVLISISDAISGEANVKARKRHLEIESSSSIFTKQEASMNINEHVAKALKQHKKLTCILTPQISARQLGVRKKNKTSCSEATTKSKSLLPMYDSNSDDSEE